MKPVLYNYSKAVKPKPYYTTPRIMGNINENKLQRKTCMYKSPAIKASFLKLKANEQYLESSNYKHNLYYVVKGQGKLNDIDYNTGDVLCINKSVLLKTNTESYFYNVDDSPLMNYYNVSSNDEPITTLHYTHDVIMKSIENLENENTNRLGVIFGTDSTNTISKTLWCLMTKTQPGAVQPPHKHNSVALDYCVCGSGYTLLSKNIDEDGNLMNPTRVNWESGLLFVTPPGWWHSHHSTDDKPGYLFPVQDAGLHMHMDTLHIEFS